MRYVSKTLRRKLETGDRRAPTRPDLPGHPLVLVGVGSSLGWVQPEAVELASLIWAHAIPTDDIHLSQCANHAIVGFYDVTYLRAFLTVAATTDQLIESVTRCPSENRHTAWLTDCYPEPGPNGTWELAAGIHIPLSDLPAVLARLTASLVEPPSTVYTRH